MAEEPPNPHDAYFRQVMSRPADAAGELRAVLPEAVTARLDWETLALQRAVGVAGLSGRGPW
ncbi:Rpn family recombination-promoting nuclease/putative transposase [Nocardia yamanashiensis]|uniref:Rpn family recombination-promoting nuclease/putative transposase n=1 Tax=Nocardia yamanashiensis TaxID=209247 RepID=UPI0038CD3BA3